MEGRTLICDSCVYSLKGDGHAKPVFEELLSTMQASGLHNYWLARTAQVVRTEDATIQLEHFRTPVITTILEPEILAFDEVDILFSARPEESANIVIGAWTGEYTISAFFDDAKFLVSFSPDFMPESVINRIVSAR
jgi:hypothetical protein